MLDDGLGELSGNLKLSDNSMADTVQEEEGFIPRFHPRTEAARERDVYRQLFPWAEVYQQSALPPVAFPQPEKNGSPSPPVGRPCPDTALVAFAQLCAVRLRARRCFVTLLSRRTEYVLVEATRTLSLQYDSFDHPSDEAWLGTSSFPRDDGLSGVALDDWRRAREIRKEPEDEGHYYTQGISPHCHIINDVRLVPEYAERRFVKYSPDLRFYASIPLRGARGSVVGCLAITDDEPRYGVGAKDMAFLEDIADTVTQHLEATIVRVQRKRSARLIQSLGLFNQGKSSLRDWWMEQEDAQTAPSGRRSSWRSSSRERKKAADKEFGIQNPSQGRPITPAANNFAASTTAMEHSLSGSTRSDAHVADRDFDQRASSSRKQKSGALQDLPPANGKPPASAEFDLAAALDNAYARASNLIREALGADGVAFVSAGMVAATLKRTGSGADSEAGPSSTTASGAPQTGARNASTDSDTSEGGHQHRRVCNVEAFATRKESSLEGSENSSRHFDMSEQYLASLIKRYPRGHIFNFAADGACYTSSGEESATTSGSNSEGTGKGVRAVHDGKRLREVMLGAQTVAFFPLWDESNTRWRSCIFVWSTSPLRFFDDVEDITYLSSWSHSILAETNKLETLAADKAKGSFISSISHELRSPLHGILAGVEFLQESKLDVFQTEMAHTISVAGRSLLDTINHVLDYAKISSSTRAHGRRRVNENEVQNVSEVDLARLTEDTVETITSAKRYQHTHTTVADEISIPLNIAWRSNWLVELPAGVWDRILSNLVGNALKYTNKGHVAVRLDFEETLQKADGDESLDRYMVQLTVQDTGIGISKQYLANDLYTPFRQADANSVGTGLGLSIVRKLCSEIGGRLNVTSELGKGTCVTLRFRAKPVLHSDAKSRSRLDASDSRAEHAPSISSIDHFYWLASTGEGSSSIGQSVIENARRWLGCDAREVDIADAAASGRTIYAVTQQSLTQCAADGSQPLERLLANLAESSPHLFVLGSSLSSVVPAVSLANGALSPVFLHQPIGPHKLLRAIASCQGSVPAASPEPAGSAQGSKKEIPAARNKPVESNGVSDPSNPLNGRLANTAEDTKSAEENDSTSGSTEELRNTILLVEDNDLNMKLLKALMHRLKLPYHCAANGREAVNAYRDNPSAYCLTLMDMSMPVMDGYTATAHIRELERKRQSDRCTIVALTGVTSEEAKKRALANGVDEFYSKPVHLKELQELVERVRRARGVHEDSR